MKRNLVGLLLFALIFDLHATSLIKVSLEEEIEEASLIVRGTLIDKYTKNDLDVVEYSINGKGDETGSRAGSIYTTFVFRIDEILKGYYTGQTIEVKKQGGCNQLGVCEGGFLEYDFNKEEQGVLLLKKMYKLDSYMSTAGGDSVYSVKNNQLIKKIEQSEVIYVEDSISKSQIGIGEVRNVLTLEILKEIIKEEK